MSIEIKAPDVPSLRAKYFPFVTSTGIEVRSVSLEELLSFARPNFARVFPHAGDAPYFKASAERLEQMKLMTALYSSVHSEHFLLYDRDGNGCGWYMGEAEDSLTFYHRNAGLLPEYRGLKVASEVTPHLEAYLMEIGYERLSSQHQSTNRAILIHQLKWGFNISGLELTERWGPLVNCVKLLREDRLESFAKQFGSTEHLTQRRAQD